jgi:hypothetical protein
MARLYLFREEMKVSTLPPVCMRCAAPATVYLNKRFSWKPEFSGCLVLPAALMLPVLLIIELFLSLESKRFRVLLPLCERCFRRGRAYRRFVLWTLVGFPLLVSAGIALLVLGNQQNVFGPVGGCLLAGAGLWALILLFVCAIQQATRISPAKITKDWMALGKVAPAFVQAVDLQRREYPSGLRQRISEIVWDHPGAYEPRYGIDQD